MDVKMGQVLYQQYKTCPMRHNADPKKIERTLIFHKFFYALLGMMFTQYVSHNTNTAKDTVYPKKYAHGFCFVVLCCGYTLTDFPISIRLTSLALWQSNDCPSASKATLMNMDKHFMWIHYERLHNHNKAKHNKTVCIFLGIYCTQRNGFELAHKWSIDIDTDSN